MKRLLGAFLIAFLVISAGPALASKRLALVVGNDGYTALPRLQKAANDARTVSEAFAKIGFEVTRVENAGRDAMAKALADFDARIGKDDIVAFFFAGHGFEIRNINYLLPIDVPAARGGQEELVRDASFAADRLVERFQNRGARTVLMILDACRDNPFPTQTRSAGTRGLARMDAAQGVFIMYSAGAKQLALDSLADNEPSPNSVFTRIFVAELLKGNRTLVDVARSTRLGVAQLAQSVGHEQVPAYYDQILGDITLTGLGQGTVKVETPALPATLPAAPSVTSVPAQPVAPPSRVAAMPGIATAAPPAPAGIAPIANFSRSNQGWMASLQIPEPAISIAYRIGETGDFEETGELPTIDPRTSKPMPNPSFSLPNDQKAVTVYVRYTDAWGRVAGPFPIAFNPLGALVDGQKRILEQMWTSWLSFRNDRGFDNLLYFTHLVSYRCAIKLAVLDVENGPSQPLPLPPCDEKSPYSIPSDFQPYIKIPVTSKKATLQITYTDGTKSRVRSFTR